MNYEDHYKILLEPDSNWAVASIDFDYEKESVLVKLTYHSIAYYAPSSGEHYPVYAHRASRQWRHLDTLQYKTFIEAGVPRIPDKEGHVRTLDVPWASTSQRHSYLWGENNRRFKSE